MNNFYFLTSYVMLGGFLGNNIVCMINCLRIHIFLVLLQSMFIPSLKPHFMLKSRSYCNSVFIIFPSVIEVLLPSMKIQMPLDSKLVATSECCEFFQFGLWLFDCVWFVVVGTVPMYNEWSE